VTNTGDCSLTDIRVVDPKGRELARPFALDAG
jgi:hypothetical protein